MWENTKRGLTFDSLHALDRCYRAGGALADVAMAMGTPTGLAARSTWVHNPQGGNGAVWAWCRPGDGRGEITVQVRWGAFVVDCSAACNDQGIFLTSPVAMSNPPAWVELKEPGWVDFGRGEIPKQLGIPVFDALSGVRVASGGHSPAGLVARDIVQRFTADEAFAQAVLHFFGRQGDVVREVFSAADPRRTVRDLTNNTPPGASHQPFTGQHWRRLRDCRCLSRTAAAKQATALMPDQRITDDHIEELENGGNPRPRFLRSRLDRVYRADGYTCVEQVKPRRQRSPFMFDLPSYWIGPIWFTFSSKHEDAQARVELRAASSYKQMQVKAGTTVTCRKPTEEAIPFEVICPRDWTVTAGMGMHSRAWDVNWGWSNLNDASSREDAPVHELFLGLFGRTKQDFEHFLRRVS